ncbi:MAG: prepilin-type N-terminal cleavage/methylation domain-containing protein [Verrucomicrobiae bacterium]|nr:prepilin-type N-terminal cleavage/methylation domain-containing protein [Verrucomicrobiae bacterium]
MSKKSGFTLVEIMIVVAIIGLLAAIAVPSFMRARMRSQASTILNECRQVDAAKDQYALENNKTGSVTPVWSDLTPYLKQGSRLQQNNGNDTLNNSFTLGAISDRLTVNTATKTTLSTAADDTFWGPFS